MSESWAILCFILSIIVPYRAESTTYTWKLEMDGWHEDFEDETYPVECLEDEEEE